MPELYEYDEQRKLKTCPAVGSQSALVCVPVTIRPFAEVGPITLHCCGDPVISPSCSKCHGKVNGTCEFTISRKIRVDVPVEFGAAVTTGDTFVECGCPLFDEDDECGYDCDCKNFDEE